jgi:hypothetical protein
MKRTEYTQKQGDIGTTIYIYALSVIAMGILLYNDWAITEWSKV